MCFGIDYINRHAVQAPLQLNISNIDLGGRGLVSYTEKFRDPIKPKFHIFEVFLGDLDQKFYPKIHHFFAIFLKLQLKILLSYLKIEYVI